MVFVSRFALALFGEGCAVWGCALWGYLLFLPGAGTKTPFLWSASSLAPYGLSDVETTLFHHVSPGVTALCSGLFLGRLFPTGCLWWCGTSLGSHTPVAQTGRGVTVPSSIPELSGWQQPWGCTGRFLEWPCPAVAEVKRSSTPWCGHGTEDVAIRATFKYCSSCTYK